MYQVSNKSLGEGKTFIACGKEKKCLDSQFLCLLDERLREQKSRCLKIDSYYQWSQEDFFPGFCMEIGLISRQDNCNKSIYISCAFSNADSITVSCSEGNWCLSLLALGSNAHTRKEKIYIMFVAKMQIYTCSVAIKNPGNYTNG